MIDLLERIDSVLSHISSFDIILLFLDFDGTLAAIRKNPKDVKLSKKAKYILNKIIENKKIITGIVSGRKIDELKHFMGVNIAKNVNLFGCHGSEIKYKGSKMQITKEAENAKKILDPIIKFVINKYKTIDGLVFEKKENSFAVNYRNVRGLNKAKIANIKKDFNDIIKESPVHFLDLKKVFEIVPLGVGKNLAIRATVKKYSKLLTSCSHVKICIGDDITDEYLFQENKEGINIKITSQKSQISAADFYLNNISKNYIFLNKLSKIK